MLYIGANQELPLIPWDEELPGFHVTKLNREGDQKVCSQFILSNVYYMGAYEGCGCGFSIGEYEEDENNELESLQARKSLADLAHYLEDALSRGISAQLFSCWDGDQRATVKHRGQVTPGEISSKKFWFKENQFLEVVQDIKTDLKPKA